MTNENHKDEDRIDPGDMVLDAFDLSTVLEALESIAQDAWGPFEDCVFDVRGNEAIAREKLKEALGPLCAWASEYLESGYCYPKEREP